MDKSAAHKAEQDVEAAKNETEKVARQAGRAAKVAGHAGSSILGRMMQKRRDKKNASMLSKRKDMVRLLEDDFKEPELDLIKECLKEAFGKIPPVHLLYRDERITGKQIGRTIDDAIIRSSEGTEQSRPQYDFKDTEYPDAAARRRKDIPNDCQLVASEKQLGKNANEKIKDFRNILEEKRAERDKLYEDEIEKYIKSVPKDEELLKKLIHMDDVKEDFSYVPLKGTGVDMRTLGDESHKALEVGNVRKPMLMEMQEGISMTEVDGNFFRDDLQEQLNDSGIKFAALTSPEGTVSIYANPKDHFRIASMSKGHIISDMSRLGRQFKGEKIAYIDAGNLEEMEKYASKNPGISISADYDPASGKYIINANISELEEQKLKYPKQKSMGLEYLEERVREASPEVTALRHLIARKNESPEKIAEELDEEMKRNNLDALFFVPEKRMKELLKDSHIPEFDKKDTSTLNVLKMSKESWDRLKKISSDSAFSYMLEDNKTSDDRMNVLFCASSEQKEKEHPKTLKREEEVK